MSKVSTSVHLRSTNVCRRDLDSATLTGGSIDSVWMVWRVSGWLRNSGMSQVSGFDFLRIVDLYRFDLDVIASTVGSNGPIQTFRVVWRWLHCAGTYPVSLFDLLHCFVIQTLDFDHYRCDLHPAVSTVGPVGPIATFRSV